MAFVCEHVKNLVWGPWLVALILGMGLLLSFRTGFVQITCFPRSCRLFLSSLRENGAGDFRALCTALAATIGTGNLVGVAGAIALGGPGTVFWMWVGGIVGMATKFAEATLAVRYRTVDNGETVGGPMYMIRSCLGARWQFLATIYAVFGIIAAFGVGNAAQINAAVCALDEVISANHLLTGAILAILVGAVVLGGAKRIGEVAEVLVPFASVVYLLLAVTVLILCRDAIPGAFRAIFAGAFQPKAAFFSVLCIGISRGVFTNEAGMGTASIAHAAAKVDHPAEQGLMGVMEVFLDTIVICTMTALVILCSGIYVPYGCSADIELTTAAFSEVLGPWVGFVIILALCLFAFATVLGWGLYGIRCAHYLFGENKSKWFAYVQILTIVLGSVVDADQVWMAAEIINGLMAIPNLIAICALWPVLRRLLIQKKDGGYYENLDQCQPLRIFPHAYVPSSGCGSQGTRQEDLPSEHWPA